MKVVLMYTSAVDCTQQWVGLPTDLCVCTYIFYKPQWLGLPIELIYRLDVSLFMVAHIIDGTDF